MTTKRPDNSTTPSIHSTIKTIVNRNSSLPSSVLTQPHHGNKTILLRGQFHGSHQDAANAVVSLILVIMVGFVIFLTVFFCRKYKRITLSIPTYQYSRLSQAEGETDLTEIVDQLGISLGISSSDDELEPATLTVSSSQYPPSNPGSQCGGHLPANGTRGTFNEDSDEELLQ